MLGPAEVETAQEEERDLRGKIVMRTTRGKQTGATRNVRVNRVRTDFNPRQMKPLRKSFMSSLRLPQVGQVADFSKFAHSS